MIKVIVSDMDGTLFKDHKKTIFNLSDRNEEALKKLHNSNISFFVASGRMYKYGIKLLKDHHFTNIICSGFNGSDIYDNGKSPIRYTLDFNIVKDILDHLKDYKNLYIQVQTLDGNRIFNNPNLPIVDTYRKQNSLFHLDNVVEIPMEEYLEIYRPNNLSKLSIILYDSNNQEEIYNIVKGIINDNCFATISGPITIEIGNPNANKGVFIKYLQDTYHYSKDEIAVIGDAMNDLEMFPYSNFSFAMDSGRDEVKEKANYIVKDVAECIDFCLNYNKAL